MYEVTKTMEISAAHKLTLDYASKCANLHGHNWKIAVTCASDQLNQNGMVEDFTVIKQMVQDKLDHHCLNDEFDFNPTAENIAKWIVDNVPKCVKAVVQESEGNVASYEL